MAERPEQRAVVGVDPEPLQGQIQFRCKECGLSFPDLSPVSKKPDRLYFITGEKPLQAGEDGLPRKPASMTVNTISLMRSDRGRNGMIYTELGSVEADGE